MYNQLNMREPCSMTVYKIVGGNFTALSILDEQGTSGVVGSERICHRFLRQSASQIKSVCLRKEGNIFLLLIFNKLILLPQQSTTTVLQNIFVFDGLVCDRMTCIIHRVLVTRGIKQYCTFYVSENVVQQIQNCFFKTNLRYRNPKINYYF